MVVFFLPPGLFKFYDDKANKLSILSMPLGHKKSSVVFIMPYNAETLARLEALLSKKQLDTWTGKLQTTAVAVSLPKVSMEVSHQLQVKEAEVRVATWRPKELTLSLT